MDPVTLGMAKAHTSTIAPNLAAKGNGAIWAIGDSIIANDYTAPTASTGYRFQSRSVLMHAVLESNGRLRFGGIAATGGYTTTQVLATHLPTVLAARPQFCLVHCGTNDAALATTIANLETIYTRLLAAGVTPVATTMLPKQTLIGASAARLQQTSLWIKRRAAQLGIPCIDWRRLVTDGGASDGWLAYSGGTGTYNGDDTHPNAAGAKVLGASVATNLASFLIDQPPWLATGGANTGSVYPTLDNALNLVDANADGVPDRWTVSGSPAGVHTLTAVAAADGVGNWWNFKRAAGVGTLAAQSTASTLTPGNRMYVACRFKTANIVTAGGAFDLRYTDSAQTANLFELFNWGLDVTQGVFAGEFTVPAGVTTGRWVLQLRTAGPTELSVAQVTAYDLTALGLD